MNLFNTVFQSVLALIGIGVIGFWILRRGILPENVISLLSRLAIDIALPSIVFANIIINFDPLKYPDWWQLPLYWVLFMSIALALTLFGSLTSLKKFKGEFTLSLFFQNGIFFPIIIISGLFGSDSPYIVQLFIFIILHPVLFFSTKHLFFKAKSDQNKEGVLNWQRIINPVLVATLLAMTIVLAGVDKYLPEFLVTMFSMLGNMTLPLVMIILGGSFYIDFQRKGKIYTWEVLKFVLIKNIVFPLVFIAFLVVVQPSYYIALIIFIQSAVPPITGVPIQVKREGGNESIANQFLIGSFIFSIISIPALFLLFNMFFPIP